MLHDVLSDPVYASRSARAVHGFAGIADRLAAQFNGEFAAAF